MRATERWLQILKSLQETGYIEVNELARMMDTSLATVRRDLDHLETRGKLLRTRGGAIMAAISTSFEAPYELKRQRYVEEKQRIAAAAVEMVLDGETIIVDAGSTCFEVAALLTRRRNLTVVTNDLQSAVKIASNPNIMLVCTGGIARANVYTLLGAQVESFLRTLRVNKTFLGADAIHQDGTIRNVNLDEVGVKRAILEAAEQVILVADSSKFQVTGFVRVGELSEIHTLITDSGIRPADRQMLSAWPVSVKVA